MALDEQVLRRWVRRVAAGEASRRDFMRAMLGLGLSGPLIADMLAVHMPAMAQGASVAPPPFNPTRRGGGKLRLLYWQPPTILNAHFAVSAKERRGFARRRRTIILHRCRWHVGADPGGRDPQH